MLLDESSLNPVASTDSNPSTDDVTMADLSTQTTSINTITELPTDGSTNWASMPTEDGVDGIKQTEDHLGSTSIKK